MYLLFKKLHLFALKSPLSILENCIMTALRFDITIFSPNESLLKSYQKKFSLDCLEDEFSRRCLVERTSPQLGLKQRITSACIIIGLPYEIFFP